MAFCSFASRNRRNYMYQYAEEKKRYYFTEELAYTEDHILVKSLLLTGISKELEPEHLQNYFQKFGAVERLHIFQREKQGKSGLRSGYIVFTNACDAGKTLQRLNHNVEGHNVVIRPRNSWHQPDHSPTPDDDPNDSPPVIMKLNDDCLEHILCYLSLPDRIHFARTCSRFRSIYLRLSPVLDKSIHLKIFRNMTLWDIRDFFRLSGCSIRHIKSTRSRRQCSRQWKLLCTYCLNIQSLSINGVNLPRQKFWPMIANLQNVEILRLIDCGLVDGLKQVETLKKLKELDLQDNRSFTGKTRLPESIVSLNLTNCISVNSDSLCKMLKGLNHLKELNIMGLELISFQTLVSENCFQSLESLSVGTEDLRETDFKLISQLPKLKKLILEMHDFQVVASLVKLNFQHLGHFEVHAPMDADDRQVEILGQLTDLQEIYFPFNGEVTDTGVLQLIIGCPKLRVLHLEECSKLTETLLKDIVWKLQKKLDHRQLPIKLQMANRFRDLNMPTNNIIDVTFDDEISSDSDDVLNDRFSFNHYFYDDYYDVDDDEFLSDEDL